jgi:chemotaxis protein methyltransferase CheR
MPSVGPLQAISAATGLRLEAFREEHVAERISRALASERVPSVDELAATLRRDARARERFRRSVAVSHSGFFRDPEQFEALEERILPRLIERSTRLRVWSAGCADGSELRSIALVLDRLGGLERSFLLGSDVLAGNVERARLEAAADPLGTRLHWEVRDLVADPPPSGAWHLVLCRNVAIYLSGEAKLALHRALAGALAPAGVLLLGRSERLVDPRALGLERAGPHAYRRSA